MPHGGFQWQKSSYKCAVLVRQTTTDVERQRPCSPPGERRAKRARRRPHTNAASQNQKSPAFAPGPKVDLRVYAAKGAPFVDLAFDLALAFDFDFAGAGSAELSFFAVAWAERVRARRKKTIT